jgi:hypothetical protein
VKTGEQLNYLQDLLLIRLDFKLLVDCVKTGEQLVLHLVAPTKQEKAAWVTDIAQVTPLFPDTRVQTTVLF